MRIREMFTVPKGKKVTEKVFARVLVSSVCSILLCAACLAGTTWAWFAVSIENSGNVIQVGTPEITMTISDPAAEASPSETGSSRWLAAGTYRVEMEHANKEDAFQQKSTLYVTLTIDGQTSVYTVLEQQNGYRAQITLAAGDACTLSWTVSWFAPANAERLEGDTILYGEEEEPTEPSTEATEPSTEATDPSEETTEPSTSPTDPSDGATEPSTEPTDPSGGATEPSTEPTDPSGGATEPSTSPTDPSDGATEPSTSPTDPGSGATEAATENTESE